MKPIAVLAFALALGAATPLYAQTAPEGLSELAQGVDDFLPAEEELPLDQLTDDFEWLDAPAEGTGSDAAPEAATPEPAPPPGVAPAAVPAGWVRHEKLGVRFATPADWVVQSDSGSEFTVGIGGDREGIAFTVMLEGPEVMDDLPPGAVVTDEPDFEAGPGATFRHRVVNARMGPVTFHSRLFLSDAPYQDDDHLVLLAVVVGLPLEEVEETLAAVLASVEADPPPARSAGAPGELAPPATPAAAVPADWVRHEKFGLRFAVPPDWEVQEDGGGGFAVGIGGETQGLAFSVMLEHPEVMDDLPPGAEIIDEPDFEAGPGAIFRQRVVNARMGPVTFHSRLFLSDAPYRDDDHLVFLVVVIGLPLEEAEETLATVLASVEADPPPPQAPAPAAPGLDIDGLVRYGALPDWAVLLRRSEGIVFATPGRDAYLTIAIGEQARRMPEPGEAFATAPHRYENATILGEPATLFEGVSREADIQAGGRMIAGMTLVHVLKRCLADGRPIAIARTASPEKFAVGGFDTLLAAIELTLPDDAIACPASDGEAAGTGDRRSVGSEPQPSAPVSPTTENWAFYQNPRFGTTVAYPAERFIAQPPSENDDGRRFVSPDGTARFVVYAGHNALGETLNDLFIEQMTLGGFDSIRDQQLAADRFGFEGTKDGKLVVFMKIIDEADIIHTFELEADERANPWLTKPTIQRIRQGFDVEPGAIGTSGPSDSMDAGEAYEQACESRSYDHNGSLMAVETCPGEISIRYARPRSGLAGAGVSPGTLLFHGTLAPGAGGDEVVGTAYVFKRGCQPAGYHVQGWKIGGTITLEGRAPVRANNCAVSRYRHDLLDFTPR